MNRIYSMAINIYRRLPDLEKAMKEVFTDSFDAEVR
jgi:16S rRNA C967 or C1407 C5-methylase (RsmB/RsmF family)